MKPTPSSQKSNKIGIFLIWPSKPERLEITSIRNEIRVATMDPYLKDTKSWPFFMPINSIIWTRLKNY